MDRRTVGAIMVDFYNSKAWKKKREHILRRDRWMDQIALRDGIHIEADVVHHILPRDEWPEYQMADWNLVAVNNNLTHKGRLHEKYTGKLTKYGKALAMATAYANGVKMRCRTLVIGMPGSGKSTWTRQHMGGGIVYEMDAIASAFRLSVPHQGEPHAGARRMAAALRSGWLAAADQYSDRIYIVRTAPDVQELEETRPDEIVCMTKQYVKRPYKYDSDDYKRQIEQVIAWANANNIPVRYVPEDTPPGL